MAEELYKKYYEKHTVSGTVAVYHTEQNGMTLTHNGHIVLTENDSFIFHEMLSHPALFLHSKPRKLAIIGPCFGILTEVLKHQNIEQISCVQENNSFDEAISRYFSPLHQVRNNARVNHFDNENKWVEMSDAASYDLVIHNSNAGNYALYQQVLNEDGLFVQPCASLLLQFEQYKTQLKKIHNQGYNQTQTLNFPQPSHPGGSRTIVLAFRQESYRRIREKDIYNRGFSTRYYNLDTHRAAMAMPEFLRDQYINT